MLLLQGPLSVYGFFTTKKVHQIAHCSVNVFGPTLSRIVQSCQPRRDIVLYGGFSVKTLNLSSEITCRSSTSLYSSLRSSVSLHVVRAMTQRMIFICAVPSTNPSGPPLQARGPTAPAARLHAVRDHVHHWSPESLCGASHMPVCFSTSPLLGSL